MIKDYSIIAIRIFLLILFQVIIFNNINLFGIINPIVYLLFILLYRFDSSQINLLLLSFTIGIIIDLFSNTAGANTIATITVSFLRPVLIKFSLGDVYGFNSLLNRNIRVLNKLIFIFLIVFIHQLIMSFVEYFNFIMIMSIIKNTIFNSFFSFIILLGLLNFYNLKS
jgi:hypothetical protein|tara:strand:+ start:257 stop:760 length:504 start_codon:yes stop_codon:yes gene_type:complete